ncbi:methyl-accepting chemotaxis protein [Vogesella sp. GCM10023246]|uniref:Methyl-accepting chemotaxis protein n=1 Tax=Vogesella oryzagri TaxID=3160864 RepID=A0ABV1M8P2_9NEIS
MRFLDNLGLRAKFLVNFLGSGGILVLAILYCLWQIRDISQDTRAITETALPSIQAVGDISQLRLRYRVRSLEYMLASQPEEQAKLSKSMDELDGSLGKAFKAYEPLIGSEEERQVYQQAVQAAADYRAAVGQAIALRGSGQEDAAQALRKGEWVKRANFLRDQTDALSKLNAANAQVAGERAQTAAQSSIRNGLIALLLGLGLALLLSLLMARRIAGRLADTVAAARRIAGGDLRSELPAGSRDEVGKLIQAMADMQLALRETMQGTRRNADSLRQSSLDLNDSVQRMEQAVNLQGEAAAGIAANAEQLTTSISHVADSTVEAAELTHSSDLQASQGHDVLQGLIGQIGQVARVVMSAAERIAQLQQESARISSIVAVIRDIADQTNLLALNAAIEAARAGEHGRGFAVVADEVRKLSERTAQSTSEIVQMVAAIQRATGEVVQEVGNSVSLTNDSMSNAQLAGDTLAQLRQLSQQVAGIVGELSAALRQQSIASTEVAQRIEDVVNHAENVTHIAHHAAATSSVMKDVVADMEKMVARFQV